MKRAVFYSLLLLIIPGIALAGFGDLFKKSVGSLLGGSEKSAASLSTDEIAAGIREALQVGAAKAVNQASREGGFTDRPAIHIPLPENIAAIGDKLRYFGLGGQADTFEKTLNTAAEKASQQALPILIQAIGNMNLQDVKRIWKGGNTAATQYLREKTGNGIYDKLLPVVSRHTESAGVTSAYKDLTDHPAIRALVSGSGFDLDHYVTDRTLKGLFYLLGREEQEIRNNPAARSTEILKKVFKEP